jgi:hypothetical protein
VNSVFLQSLRRFYKGQITLHKSDVATTAKMNNIESYDRSYPRHVGACVETSELKVAYIPIYKRSS